jgi:hypothetical protein
MTEKTYDGVTMLSQLSGRPKAEIQKLWEEVKINIAKLNGCPRHRFEDETVILGQRICCVNCGGNISLGDISHYIKGFVAAGGEASVIWPAYHDKYVVYREL